MSRPSLDSGYNPSMLPISILHKDTTESTMDDARGAVLSGYGHGTLCTAAKQSSGRGRIRGRKWEGGEGALLFTLVIHENEYNAAYPLTQFLALAVCYWLENRHGLEPRIKWPNDVCISGSKIAGMLVEREGPFFLAGVGVNLNSSPETLRQTATSLILAKGIHTGYAPFYNKDSELSALLAIIERNLGAGPPIEEVAGRLRGIGAGVKLCLGNPARKERLRGKMLGLQADGALLIAMKSGKTHAVYSGEIEEIRIDVK